MKADTTQGRKPEDGMAAGPGLALAVLLALAAMLAVALFRPDAVNPWEQAGFFRMKLAWRQAADIVVVGNSQVYRGVNPAAFAPSCPDLKALNFGFSAVFMRSDYLDASTAVLRQDGPKVLLVGINPLQFKDASYSDGFLANRQHEREFKLPWRFERWLDPLFKALRPLEKPYPPARWVSWDHRDDGFVASDARMQINPSRYARYAEDYRQRPFSEAMYAAMLERLAGYRSRGYRVLLFSTYSSPRFEQIDADMTGLDDTRLQADAARFGLEYLPLATDGLRSYDGTHLDAASASVFSRRLGQAIAARLGPALCAPGTAP